MLNEPRNNRFMLLQSRGLQILSSKNTFIRPIIIYETEIDEDFVYSILLTISL